MKRLRLLILIFFLSLSIPLAYFVLRTYSSLEQEEEGKLRYFAETLFDEMEKEFTSLVLLEEGRAINEYSHNYIPPDQVPGSRGLSRSPLSRLPKKPYILGYLQNNPDSSFQSPLVENEENIPGDQVALVQELKEMNKALNRKRETISDDLETPLPRTAGKKESEETLSFADRYLTRPRSKKQKVYLGQEEKRVDQITARQAQNVAQLDRENIPVEGQQEAQVKADKDSAFSKGRGPNSLEEEYLLDERTDQAEPSREDLPAISSDTEMFQVEVAPLQSVFIDDRHIFVFRRIVINNQIYRQGFVLIIKEFMDQLLDKYFAGQPMAHFTDLRLKVVDRGREIASSRAGALAEHPDFLLDRTFPRPFSFLQASLLCDKIPRSPGRRTLSIMMVMLAGVVLLGLFAIHQSAHTIVDLSERRSGFVSSVTHELKTPLTNIRMYVEMLEQGIARDQEREQEYFGILGSESARLSRLINNVLEFSKLENKQRHLDQQEGTFEEVIQEVRSIMQEKLRQEGFIFSVEAREIQPFKYDREVMVQVLINLIENSMKFGKDSSTREITLRLCPENDTVKISVADTGPGIPNAFLKKVFDDFYRVDDSLTRTTRGTGIGLALVKKFITAMDGTVSAANNEGPGCTITITLPS